MSENEGADPAPDADAPTDAESTDDEGRSSGEETRDRSAADETDASAAADGTERSASGDGAEEPSDARAAEPSADEAEGDTGADGADGGSDSRGSLADRVDDASTAQLADEIAALRDRVETLERAVDDREETVEALESKLKRKQADFQNFKKRQERKREEERQRATEDLVERLLDVRDNLVRALDQEEGSDIRGGVETTLRQFDRVFDAENVRTVDPEPGAAVDPGRHEVLMRVESDQEAGTVADLHRPGYEMAGKVLRPAQVTVAAEADDGADSPAEDATREGSENAAGDGDEATDDWDEAMDDETSRRGEGDE